MVQLIVRMTATAGREHDLVEALHTQMRHTRRQGGCSRAIITADVDEAHTFWYCEDWQDAARLEDELRTDRFSQLLALMETSAQPPVLEFRMIAETRGLEYVAAVRAAAQVTES